ncbi:MAG: hypothetical protein M3Q40_10020 [Pseudomonadota bacterium]|nr:hypothetical protein [Pseudomonadota bacterium]
MSERSTPISRKRGSTRLSVASFGAAGDGDSDDTAAFQRAIDALPAEGGTVYVPRGSYRIDTRKSVALRNNLLLDMHPEAHLRAIPNDAPRYAVLLGVRRQDVEIRGGRIEGDRLRHTYTDTGNSRRTHEWGMGIALRGCRDVTIVGTRVSMCTGDGLSVSGTVDVHDVISQRNRRQGLSAYTGTVRVFGGRFSDTGDIEGNPGTAPMAGIDVEPDSGRSIDVVIDGAKVLDNQTAGVLAWARAGTGVGIRNMTVRNCEIARNANGVHAKAVGDDTVIDGFHLVDNYIHHQRASGIRLDRGVRNANIAGNTFERNHTRQRARAVRDFQLTGPSPATDRDLLVTGDAKVTIGVNRYR